MAQAPTATVSYEGLEPDGSNLFISFSGGRTSAYMTYLLKQQFPKALVVFANTGQEDERTLAFVKKCDEHFGWQLHWVEAVVDPRPRKGTQGKRVSFETAARNGEPFEEMIKKYGIPNKSYPHCTRELKQQPMHNYIKKNALLPKHYFTAIGIRADEVDRMAGDAKQKRYIYPLIQLGITKLDVNFWWAGMPFDLETPEHYGNCVTCWKKSNRKLLTLMKNDPARFEFFERMEREYPHAGAGEGARVFWRSKMTTQDLHEMAKKEFNEFKEEELDLSNGCIESCEVF